MKNSHILLVMLIIASCGKTSSEKSPTADTAMKIESSPKKLEMYTMSEMSKLMEKLYADNKQLRKEIILGKDIGVQPNYYDKLFNAKMTDADQNDAFFQAMAKSFINSQKVIYEQPENLKVAYNNSINVCIECHKVKCLGPIPRIKKLIIN